MEKYCSAKNCKELAKYEHKNINVSLCENHEILLDNCFKKRIK